MSGDSDPFDVKDRYIVTLKPKADVAKHMRFVHNLHHNAQVNGKPGGIFTGISRRYKLGNFRGYSGHFDQSVIDSLKHRKDVAAVEADQLGTNIESDQHQDLVKQIHATWGLHHISHHDDKERGVYWFDKSAGNGTIGYVIDGGIRATHNEFGHRVSLAYNAIKSSYPFEDTDGHGTHVASLMCGKLLGVAKKCRIKAIKVTHQGTTTMGTLIDGFAWAAEDIIFEHQTAKAVINVSIGGPFSSALNYAVNEAYKMGVATIVAAGNENSDARRWSPSSAYGAIPVGATNAQRTRAPFSNYGTAVALFAPGVCILGASHLGDKKARFMTGTSMASPYVAGLALYFKALEKLPDARSTRKFLQKVATPGVVRDTNSANNLFAYNNCGK
ncbi:allergen Asp fl 1 [Myriangium duriaei CBS 260.36]|uniref:Allergen Asp fl 1 n=1 Tax=Myriangium duriaei CBS 260.36 TaxID=1168546 RepID=A0A9P4MC96_9PEZI|nr:allergen Asp fl 1 [Myriangium duriaei CBS 260.36]